MEGHLANFQVGVAQNLTHGDEKNSRRFAEIQEQILTCQEGLGHLVEGQREITRTCQQNALQASVGAQTTQDSLRNSHMALVRAFGEISQKTDSIAHAIKVIPDLRGQIEVLQTQVVSLCSEGAHTGPSPEMLGHLAEAQRARDQLLAESQRLHAANLANEKKDLGLRDFFLPESMRT